MKMPSIKYYNNRARTFGILLIVSVCGYYIVRAILDFAK
jgi:hypothetical protein